MQVTAALLELESVVLARGLAVLEPHESEQFEQLSLHVFIGDGLKVHLGTLVYAAEHLNEISFALLRILTLILAVLDNLLERD
mmetsp:Transcript_22883/g.28442  ORF Transcript_22883/g.28442 Transcript_22883/m.28442 type:complete len:83 (-) Transcript_22883:244-492(-)